MGSFPRVLHIVESLDSGSVENWLVRSLEHGRLCGVNLDWSFYCQLPPAGCMDEKARSLGASVINSPVPISNKVYFVRALRAEMRAGRYDVIHCHHDLISAVYLAASIGLPIRRRIVHIHNADEELLTPSSIKQRIYREPFRKICLAAADCIAATSNHALDTFLAGRPRNSRRHVVLYCSVDPAPFKHLQPDYPGFRRNLGFSENAVILLFASRMVREKNPVYAVDVLAELRRREPRAVGVFAGSGELDSAVRERICALELQSFVRTFGWRSDIPEIMACSDLFIHPHPESPMEGFGLAVVEAQLAGLRLLISTGVADDPLLPGACFRRLPLSAGPKLWADAALQLLNVPAPSRSAAREALMNSPLDPDKALSALMELHRIPAPVEAETLATA